MRCGYCSGSCRLLLLTFFYLLSKGADPKSCACDEGGKGENAAEYKGMILGKGDREHCADDDSAVAECSKGDNADENDHQALIGL